MQDEAIDAPSGDRDPPVGTGRLRDRDSTQERMFVAHVIGWRRAQGLGDRAGLADPSRDARQQLLCVPLHRRRYGSPLLDRGTLGGPRDESGQFGCRGCRGCRDDREILDRAKLPEALVDKNAPERNVFVREGIVRPEPGGIV